MKKPLPESLKAVFCVILISSLVASLVGVL